MELIISDSKKKMEKTIANYINVVTGIRAGAPSTQLVDRVKFSYHGFPTEIKNVSYISVSSNFISIKPFEKEHIHLIAEAVAKAQPTLQIKEEADLVKVVVPPLSGERRKELVKELSRKSEEAKVALRNIRRNILDEIKKDKSTSEDQRKRLEKQLQEVTDEMTKKIETLTKSKEKELQA